MQADKTVTYPITVATQELAGLTQLADMPRCRYEVIDPETRDTVDVVTVGSQYNFRCSIDRYLLDNLEYGPGPLQAQKEAHAFKFADKVGAYAIKGTLGQRYGVWSKSHALGASRCT
ncbi:unnamed protein product [Strongylus vulgaris]|uniref:Uncharacterized protein n=1 Tax=Strongylus vulgaris TaxID=40348 RepID=A0A3P7J9Z4_STRVU|nr:unnamed protein product [Strongylus vulgaris]